VKVVRSFCWEIGESTSIMKAYPGRAKKFESPGGLYDSVGGGSFSGLYINLSVVYRTWPAVSLPRVFQLGHHPGPHGYHLHHGKHGNATEGDHYSFVRQKQFPGHQELDAEYGCTEWRNREEDILEAYREETSNLFEEAFPSRSPKKKSKLRVRFASTLVQTVPPA